MRSSFPLNGGQVRFQFEWSYLDRSNIVVTSGNDVPRSFKWINDHEIEVKNLFGDPLTAEDSPLVIQRVTPDLECPAAASGYRTTTGSKPLAAVIRRKKRSPISVR